MAVRPESVTAPEYPPSGLSNQTDSGGRWHGQKSHVACPQVEHTCRIVATAFDASVDVTGASQCSLFGPTKLRFLALVTRSWLSCANGCLKDSDELMIQDQTKRAGDQVS